MDVLVLSLACKLTAYRLNDAVPEKQEWSLLKLSRKPVLFSCKVLALAAVLMIGSERWMQTRGEVLHWVDGWVDEDERHVFDGAKLEQ